MLVRCSRGYNPLWLIVRSFVPVVPLIITAPALTACRTRSVSGYHDYRHPGGRVVSGPTIVLGVTPLLSHCGRSIWYTHIFPLYPERGTAVHWSPLGRIELPSAGYRSAVLPLNERGILERNLRFELRLLAWKANVLPGYTNPACLAPGLRIELRLTGLEAVVLPLHQPGTDIRPLGG